MRGLFIFLLIINMHNLVGCTAKNDLSNTKNIQPKTEQKNTDVKSDNNKQIKDDSIFEIREKMFISQCNDIYLNAKDFEGRTIKIEGFCDIQTDPKTGEVYYGVIRKGPGCCGNDGVAGFEFTYEGKYPKKNDWLEVVGKIVLKKVNNDDIIVIQASSVTVKDTRGADYVAN